MNEDSRTNKIVIIGSILCSLVLLGVLSTFAYIILSPTEAKEDLRVGTGTLSLTFQDNNPGFNKQLEFGSSAEKTFSITNDGTLEGVAKINWKNITNTYLKGSLTYSLAYSETENGDYAEIITNELVPRSETPQILELANGLVIPAGKTYYYKLTITLNYLDNVDQTADLSASLTTEFSVEEEPKSVKVTFNSVGGTVQVTDKKVYLNSNYGELPVPVKKGYNFLGWFTEETGGEKITSESELSTLGDKTLYAHWEEKLVQVAFGLKANPAKVTSYNLGEKEAMYTFEHPATEQTPALTDYRYIGESPNNYIEFNDEVWRIIGIFSVQNEYNTYQQRIKIIKNKALGTYNNLKISWDRKTDKTWVNEWPSNTLFTMLNGNYLYAGGAFTHVWYDGAQSQHEAPIQSLNSTAINQLSLAKWYLGSPITNGVLSGANYYNSERSTATCVTNGRCSGETRSTNVVARVGLMYPSDYIYTRVNNKSWLTGKKEWNISPCATCTFVNSAYINNGATTGGQSTDSVENLVRPVVYLRSNIQIIDGDGTEGNPYKIK